MMPPHTIVDDFLDDPDAYRSEAIKLPYYEIRGPDGGVYRHISVRPTTEHKEKIELALGRTIKQDYSFCRFATFGAELRHTIHADSGLSPYAMVLYLNPADQIPDGSGTAFWEHRNLKIVKVPTEEEVRASGKSPKRVWNELESSWNDETKWKESGRVPMKYNRAIFFETVYFHSRLPLNGFGNTIDDARLIFVSFFRA